MARALNKLTAEATEAISKPGRHSDGGNLYLAISADGRRRWTFLYTWNGSLREAGLGAASAGGVSLEEAREKAAEGRALVRAGIDPIAEWSRMAPRGDDDLIIAWLCGREKLLQPSSPSRGCAALVRRLLRIGEPWSNRLAKALEPVGSSQMTLKLEYREHRGRGRPRKDIPRRTYEDYKIVVHVNTKIVAQEASGGRKPKRSLVEEEAARETGMSRSTVQAAFKRIRARRARRNDEYIRDFVRHET
jgi:Arm DNA-binding domain